MSKKTAGLSFEEKRQRALAYFTETADFFQLKELEKILPKAKGIGNFTMANVVVMQSVKEVVQSLVDDRLVSMEKIGTSNYFWCFPSAALQSRRNLLDKLEAEERDNARAIAEMETSIAALTAAAPETPERTADLHHLSSLEARLAEQKAALAHFADCDPEVYAAMEDELAALIDSYNQQLDNLYALQKFVSGRFGISRGDFFQQFGIEEDDRLEYLEATLNKRAKTG